MNLHRRLVSIVLALSALACGDQGDNPTLNHYGDEMLDSVDGLAASLSAHHEAVLEAGDLQQLRAMERRHHGDMQMHMGRARDARDSLERCGEDMRMAGLADGGEPLHEPRMAMAEAFEDAAAEVEHHMRAAQDAADMDAAQGEEHRHRGAMEDVVQRMRMHGDDMMQAMHAMQAAGMSMMCPADSHMHMHGH